MKRYDGFYYNITVRFTVFSIYILKRLGEFDDIALRFYHIFILTAVEPTKSETNVACKDVNTGKQYLPGEGWNINDCVSCFCGNDGQGVCHETKCSVSKCKNPVHLQARCCPVCPEIFHSGEFLYSYVHVSF